jgi:hypothetical protein
VNNPAKLTDRRIGFVSTRFAGTDGVIVPEALFTYPDIHKIYDTAFSQRTRPSEIT